VPPADAEVQQPAVPLGQPINIMLPMIGRSLGPGGSGSLLLCRSCKSTTTSEARNTQLTRSLGHSMLILAMAAIGV
jgi:hypothetical protein